MKSRLIRESFNLHTRFETQGSFFEQYRRALQDSRKNDYVNHAHGIDISETHRKLIRQAQYQNILHKDIGYVRAIRLSHTVFYYDVGLRAIDGEIFSRGTSLALDEAMARAFGELYERVSMRFIPFEEDVVYTSYKKIKEKEGESVLNIFSLAQATKEQKIQYKNLNWDENSIFGWVVASHASTKKLSWVPAQLVYWNYKRFEGEPFLGEINTSGLGAGYSFEDAVSSAASELVQRHSFFWYWYQKKAPPKIEVQSVLADVAVPKSLKDVLVAVRQYGFEVNLLDCTLKDGTASVATILTKRGIGWFVGMSTSEEYEKAIERSVCEALSVYTWAMNGVADARVSPFDVHALTGGFCDNSLSSGERICYWTHEDVAKNGSFFLEGEEISFSSIAQKKSVSALDMLLVHAKDAVFIKRAQHTYLSEVDFSAVRVIAPHLYKLALSERFSTPVLDGVQPKNIYPHPFP